MRLPLAELAFFAGEAFGFAGVGAEDLGVYVEAFFVGEEVLAVVE